MKLKTTVSVLAGTYLLAIMPSMRKHPNTENMKQYLYAHRGLYDNVSGHPENSMRAFELAVMNGFGIELDVQLTKDSQVVVFHDFSLSRMVRDVDGNRVDGKVCDYTYEQLCQFHLLNSPEKIPLFQDVLDTVHGQVPLIVELKIENDDRKMEVCRHTDKLLQEYTGLYCVESFHPGGVLWYRIHRSSIMRGQLADKLSGGVQGSTRLVYFLCENLLFNFLTRPDFVAYNRKCSGNLSRLICRYLFGNTAVSWTVQSKEELLTDKKRYDLFIFESFLPK